LSVCHWKRRRCSMFVLQTISIGYYLTNFGFIGLEQRMCSLKLGEHTSVNMPLRNHQGHEEYNTLQVLQISYCIWLIVSSYFIILGISQRVQLDVINAFFAEATTIKSAVQTTMLSAYADIFQNCRPNRIRTWDIAAYVKSEKASLRLVI
jgi:hypothetical protein